MYSCGEGAHTRASGLGSVCWWKCVYMVVEGEIMRQNFVVLLINYFIGYSSHIQVSR